MAMNTDLLDQAFLGELGGTGTGNPWRRAFLVVVLVLLLAAAGYLAWWLESRPPGKPHLALGPITSPYQMTLGLADGHYLDVGIAFQLTNMADTTEMKSDTARIDNAIIDVYGAMTYTQVISPEGRSQALSEVVSDVNGILGSRDGLPQVSTAYYTTYIPQ
jgi:flagellar basal body-associated protein FliL